MDLTQLSDRERLIAEQAVLAFRESMRAMEAAPHGQGLSVTERAVQEQGRRTTLAMMEQALLAADEGNMGGPLFIGLLVRQGRRAEVPFRSEDRHGGRRGADRAEVLPLHGLQAGGDPV